MSRVRLGVALALALGLSAPLRAADSSEPCDCHAVTAWTTKDGLPSGNIMAMAQDRQGFLWLGMSGGGLVRFDGLQFSPWGSNGEPALPGDYVPALLGAKDGSLWVVFGHSPGVEHSALVSRIVDGRVTTYSTRDGLPAGTVAAIREDRHGTIWVAGSGGLATFDGRRWRPFGRAEGLPELDAFSLYEDREGDLWTGTSAGVYRRPEGAAAFELYDATLTSVQSFAQHEDGTIWIADDHAGTRTLARTERPVAPRLPAAVGSQILHDGRGTLWFAALGAGLFRINPSQTAGTPRIERFNYEGHFNGPARSLFLDRENNIWVGMRGSGLLRLSRTPIATDIPLEGVANDGVRGMAATADGSVWVATGHTLNRFAGGQRRTYRVEQVASLHTNSRGDLWIASAEGIRRFVEGRFETLDLGGDAQYERASSFTFDSGGNLWLCSNTQGVFMWRKGQRTPTRFDDAPLVAHRPCTSLFADVQGRMWIGFTNGGVAVFDDGSFHLYGSGHGLAEGSVVAIQQTKNGAIWIATTGAVTRVHGDRFTTVSRRNGLPGKIVPSLVEDDEGFIWLGVESGAGLIRFSVTEMDEIASDPTRQFRFRLYDESDGLQGPIVRLNRVSAAKDRSGRLWFVSGRGVAVVDLRALQTTQREAVPRIQSVLVDGMDRPVTESMSLSAGTQTVQVDYAALSLSSSSKVRFKYMLEGLNQPAWMEAGDARRASFTSLAPGTYRFHVKATSDGLWQGPDAVLGFTVQPPFYKTYGFSALCLTGCLGLLWAFQRLRMRAVRNEYSLILAERARVSRDIHDTLLQSLGAFNLQLEVVARELGDSKPSASNTVQHLRSQVAQCIHDARRSIWDLRSPRLEAHDLVEAFRQIAGDAEPVAVEVTTRGRIRRIAPQVEDQLLKIGQEAIGNAIRHGHATRVDVTLDYRRAALALHISDNGCGFDPDAHVEASDGHWGLKNMRDRAENIGGRLGIISRPGHGTSIQLLAPL